MPLRYALFLRTLGLDWLAQQVVLWVDSQSGSPDVYNEKRGMIAQNFLSPNFLNYGMNRDDLCGTCFQGI
ncbi:hypothetical protein VRK_22540 [Vibrio sp. MEBiC08052]|nr:hypothetical protein VRK_22540 [Vibrio sp. MEBiC08052]